MGRLETSAPHNAGEAIAYLARRPYDNVYVGWLIASGRAGVRDDIALWREPAGRITGACYAGAGQIVPCVDEASADDALDAFAAFVRRGGYARTTRMVIGPRLAVDGLWQRTKATFPTPRAVRASQPVYALIPADLTLPHARTDVERATRDEIGELARESALMIAGELGRPPASPSDTAARTARIIDAGWWWRYRVAGRLAFTCYVGAVTAHTAQVQGVWTPLAMRGRGYASQAFGAICERLLREHPSLCLYVNAYNTSAIALYERVGFRRNGEFASLFFD